MPSESLPFISVEPVVGKAYNRAETLNLSTS